MTIPKEIVEKMEKVNELTLEISKWMFENIDTDGTKHRTESLYGTFVHEDYYQFTDTPKGDEQDEGEYCNQHQSGEDSFWGQYYYPTEKGNYFWFDFYL